MNVLCLERNQASLATVLALLLAAGCTGDPAADTTSAGPETDDDDDGDESDDDGESGGGDSSGGESGDEDGSEEGSEGDDEGEPPASPGLETCPTTALPRTPLRRLTRFEYTNTVRDLLGVDASAARDLPADEVTQGFDNNAGVLTVSSLHAEKYVLVSEALAALAVEDLEALTACDAAARGEETCATDFARSFGRRAFRRPLTSDDEDLLLAAYEVGSTGGSHAEGIEVMIRAALQSPHFLYRLEALSSADETDDLIALDPYEVATRLSYLIWASGPDDALLDAAESGDLDTPEQIAAKAREMLESSQGRLSLTNFFTQWSGLSRLEITTKNATLFPRYSEEVQEAMAQEFPAFLDDMLERGDATLRTLLTSESAFVTGPLADLYGVSAPSGGGATPRKVTLPDEHERAGLLTQAGFLSVQSHPDQTSPVLRGKFVRAMLLCSPPPPPPDDVDVSVPELGEGATARDRFGAHLEAGGSCAGCHILMDPIGFAFEQFDALGEYRETENGVTIDVSGEIFGFTDPALEGSFEGVRELADKLAESDVVSDCMATQLFTFGSGRTATTADSCSIATLQDAFREAEGDLVELVVAMTQTDAFLYRTKVTQ